MRVLISGGGTTQKIDQMRTITNKSTGRTAILLAEKLRLDNDVTLLLSENVNYENTDINILRFSNVKSLKNQFLSLKDIPFDIIIHAAAVSDYELKEISSEGTILTDDKIPSGLSELTLKLKPTEKIINSLRTIWPKAKLVGFKLTSGISRNLILKGITRVLTEADLDFIIHNDLVKRRLGYDSFTIFNPKLNETQIDTINDLAKHIILKTQSLKEVTNDSLS